jgi:DNA invertase Pin-like site-specific DNA recombinase
MATALRFAILARVSTETQEKEGESLAVQKKILTKCVEMLNGTIVKEYIGSESATSGEKERPILDEMLADSRKHLFDALMVYDLSRLTRDPIKSKIILAELKKHNIRLYVQTQLYNLDSPETNLVVGLLSEINAFQAAIQVQKSVESKIELAKKGWHVFGHPPFGRKLEHNDRSKAPVWIIDPEGLKKAQEIYDYYINQGIYVDKLAQLIGFSRHTIYHILKDKGQFKQTLDYNRPVPK